MTNTPERQVMPLELTTLVDADPELEAALNDPDIMALVNERLNEVNQTVAVAATTPARSIDLIPFRDVSKRWYIYEINIHLGVADSIKIDCDELEVNKTFTQEVKQQRGRHLTVLPIFPELTKRGTQLDSEKDKLQRFMKHVGGYWFVSEDKLDQVNQLAKDLQSTCKRLKQEVLLEYPKAYARFLARAKRIMISTRRLSRGRIDELLMTRFKPLFPSYDHIEQEFRVVIKKPLEVPSLQDVGLMAEDEITKEWLDVVHDAIYVQARPLASEKAYELFGKLMGKFEKLTPGKLTPKQVEVLKDLIDELGVQVDFEPELGQVFLKAQMIRGFLVNGIDQPSYDKLLADLREDFMSQLDKVAQSGRHGQNLASQVATTTLDQQIRNLQGELEQVLQGNQTAEVQDQLAQFAELEARVSIFGELLKDQAETMQTRLAAMRQRMRSTLGVAEPATEPVAEIVLEPVAEVAEIEPVREPVHNVIHLPVDLPEVMAAGF